MKRILFGTFALLCLTIFIPSAFAGEDVPATDGADTPRFNPTLRVGCAFDAGDAMYGLRTERVALSGLGSTTLKLPSTPRVYLATELPVAVTDRLTLSLGGSWAFYTKASDVHESITIPGPTFNRRDWERENRDDWVTADFTVSYAFVKDVSIIRNLSVVGSLRWDYRDVLFTNAHNPVGIISTPTDEIDIQMQTLAPVFGLTCTLAGRESEFFGGDIKLGVLAGPVVWSKVAWRETFDTPSIQFGFKGHPSNGYVVNTFVELPVYSGTIKPGLDGSVSLFADYTRTAVRGTVDGARYAPVLPVATSPYHFESVSDVMVLGIETSLAFDLCGRPEPVSMPPAPAPVIEPKLEPMSGK